MVTQFQSWSLKNQEFNKMQVNRELHKNLFFLYIKSQLKTR